MERERSLLSNDAISYLFTLEPNTKTKHETELTLQIITIQKTPQKNRNGSEMYTATLIDTKYSYAGFVIIRSKEEKSHPLKENDVITTQCVHSITTTSNSKRLFIISKISKILSALPLLYLNTVPYTENANNKTKFLENKEESALSNEIVISGIDAEMKLNENKYTPVKHLTTFTKTFCILVRVLTKSQIKNLFSTNANPRGSWFYFVGIDKDRVEIQIMCFNKIAEHYYQIIKEDEIYEITDGFVKVNDNKNIITTSEYKIVLNDSSRIYKVNSQTLIQPKAIKLNTISEMASFLTYKEVNTLGYVLSIYDKELKHTKNGDIYMRKLILGDASSNSIHLILWRDLTNYDIKKGDVILIKKAKIGEFNGVKNISTYEDSIIEKNPQLYSSEVEKIKEYMKEHLKEVKPLVSKQIPQGKALLYNVDYINDIITMLDRRNVNSESISMTFRIKVTITQIMHNEKNVYEGCPNEGCKKKLDEKNIIKVCDKCGETFEKGKDYYNISARVKDCSAEFWIDFFGKCAEELFGMSADVYKKALIAKQNCVLNAISYHVEFSEYMLYVKPRIQFFGMNSKKKLYVTKIERIDNYVERKKMITGLRTLLLKNKS